MTTRATAGWDRSGRWSGEPPSEVVLEAAKVGSGGAVGDVPVGADEPVADLAGSGGPQSAVGRAVDVMDGTRLGSAAQPVDVDDPGVAVERARRAGMVKSR